MYKNTYAKRGNIFNTPIYSSNTSTCIHYQLSVYELRSVLSYFDPKFATPEYWKSFVDHIMSIYPQAKELILEFIRKNAPDGLVPYMESHVGDYINRDKYIKKVDSDIILCNLDGYFGKLNTLEYYVKEDQKLNFKSHIQKLDTKSTLSNSTNYLLGQLREELLLIDITNPSQLIDKVISVFRDKVQVHNRQVRTFTDFYTYDQARRVLGTFQLYGREYNILEIINCCPYFNTSVEVIPNVSLFCDQVTIGKYAISGSRRDLAYTRLWYYYKDWCTKMDIPNPVSEKEFTWQCTIPMDELGVHFVTSKLDSIWWESF